MKIIIYNKKVPYSLNLEGAVLGSLLINKKCLEKVIDILKPEIFYKIENKIIFKNILYIYNKYKKVDFITLIYQLKKNNELEKIGGEVYITSIFNSIYTFSNIEQYVEILINKFILRKLINLSIYIRQKSYEENIDTLILLNKIQDFINEIFLKYINTNINSISKLLPKTIKNLKKNYIKTGFIELDKIILGLQKSDLIIVASRPGMGKTSFALSLIIKLIKKKIPLALFTLEMSYYQIITRLIILKTNLNYEKLKNNKLNKKEKKILKKKIKTIKKYPFYIDDSSFLSIIDLKNKCRKLIYKYKVKVIIIDYLQLINVTHIRLNNREQEISTISRNIKYIAKEFKITIIAISQLSRAAEIRGGYKRPMLTDLRESGAIEQDADIVLLLYRPEYYGFKFWDYNQSSCKGEAELIIAKHRNGKLGTIKLKFIKKKALFTNFK